MNNTIDTKVNMLYDFIYSKSFINNIKQYNIKLNKIILDDIKIKNNTPNLQNILNELFNGKFKLIEYNDKNNMTILKRYTDGLSIGLYISPYKSLDNVDQIDNINNNDALFSYILSNLVLNKKTHNILLPIINIDVDFQQIENIIKPHNSIYKKYNDMMESTNISNMFSVRLKEQFFKCMTLQEYLNNTNITKDDLKKLLFQVIYNLALLQNEYKGFRHNLLSPDNIYIYIKKDSNKILKYDSIEDTSVSGSFYVPDRNFDIKITNFFGASIPDLYSGNILIPYINEKKSNDYLDLHYFLNCLMKLKNIKDNMDKNTLAFINRIIPAETISKKSLYMKKYVELFKPIDLLEDGYFEEYRKERKIIEPLVESDFYLGTERNNINNGMRRVKNDTFELSGGGKYFSPLNKQYKNSPFLSNENRRINTMNAKPEDNNNNEKPSNIIASQEISVNPDYKKPFVIKEKPTFDNNHEEVEKKHFIPQSKPIYKQNNWSKPSEYTPQQQPNITSQPILAEQKVYQTAIPPQAQTHSHPKYTNPSFISLDNNMNYPPAFVPEASNYFPYMKPLERRNEIPLQQIYQINLGNPTVHSNTLNKIYEDSLPGDPYNFTMKSIYERNYLINFLRNSIGVVNDGDEMTIQAGKKSLMEFIKIMDFNPYTIGKNKYSKLPMNFLLYNAAYPIRYNLDTRTIDIAKYAIGMNIRMYMMSVGALNFKKGGYGIVGLNDDNFDVWRDIKYYQTIKTDIVDTKRCPNFITIFLYKLDTVSTINYANLYTIIQKHTGMVPITRELTLRSQINNALNPFYLNKLAPGKKAPTGTAIQLDSCSGDSMIVITEAPTCNLIEWASPVYKHAGVVNTMTSTGFHSPDIWKSVLFQIAYAIAILEDKSIYFRNFSIENNIFIKDIFSDSNNIGHWEYKINDTVFYVPNFGYLVLLDSKYNEVDTTNLPVLTPVPTITMPATSSGTSTAPATSASITSTPFTQYFKIESTIYTKKGNDIKYDYKNLIRNNCFIKIFENFNNFITINEMSPLDPTILTLIKKLHSIPLTTSIKDYLIECFPDFLHTRVGTMLTKAERDSINPSIMCDPLKIKGNMIVYQSRFDEYKWGIYLKPLNNKQYSIYEYDRATNRGSIKNVFYHSIVYYPDPENILQVGDRAYKLNKDSLIESYSF